MSLILHEKWNGDWFRKVLENFRINEFKDVVIETDCTKEQLYASIVEATLPVVVPLDGNKELLMIFKIMIDNNEPNGGCYPDTIGEILARPNCYQVKAWVESSLYQMAKTLMLLAITRLLELNSDAISELLVYLKAVTTCYTKLPLVCVGFKRRSVRKSPKAMSYRAHYYTLINELQEIFKE